MGERKEFSNILRDQRHNVFLAIGGLTLVLALVVRLLAKEKVGPIAGSMVQDVAIVFLTVAVLQVFWTWLGGDPTSQALQEVRDVLDVARDAHTLGVTRLYGTSANLSSAWSHLADRAENGSTILLMSPTLDELVRTQEFADLYPRLLGRQVKIKALMLSPTNPDLWSQERRLHTQPEYYEQQLDNSLQKLGKLSEQYKGSVEVRVLERGTMGWALLQSGDSMLATPLLRTAPERSSPTFQLSKGKGIFDQLVNEFDALWGMAGAVIGGAAPSDHANTDSQAQQGIVIASSQTSPAEEFISQSLPLVIQRLAESLAATKENQEDRLLELERVVASSLARYLSRSAQPRVAYFYLQNRDSASEFTPSPVSHEWLETPPSLPCADGVGQKLLEYLEENFGAIVPDVASPRCPADDRGLDISSKKRPAFAYWPISFKRDPVSLVAKANGYGFLYLDGARSHAFSVYDAGPLQVLGRILACGRQATERREGEK